MNEALEYLKRHIESIRDGKLCGVMVALSGAFDSQSLHEIRKKHLKEFALDLGKKFSHIINYLSPQKIVFLSEGKIPPKTFIDAFSESINKSNIDTDKIILDENQYYSVDCNLLSASQF